MDRPLESVNEKLTEEISAVGVRERGLTATDEWETTPYAEVLDFPIHITEHRLR